MYWQDAHRTLYNGNCRAMTELPDESIQCCVTSPPYWGLRKYAGEQESVWGGTPDCRHIWIDSSIPKSGGVGDYEVGRVGNAAARTGSHEAKESNTCSLCGAWRGAYGLEPTPALYVQHTVEILREVRRVLRSDGCVFWNIGDSYANKATEKGKVFEKFSNPNRGKTNLIKAKDLCLIPQRVAIAAQDDGWWVRSIIIWSKPNPMPESVTDRPTESHEYILMITKSAHYFWDMESVREDCITGNGVSQGKVNGKRFGGDETDPVPGFGNRELFNNPNVRNLRSVWTFPTQPYPGSHFATFPEVLPERCIKAASKPGDIILDPFSGSGTVLEVAAKLNRKAVGYEISEEYCKLIVERNRQGVFV